MEYPLVNGTRSSFNSIELVFEGVRTVEFKEISYKETLDGELVRGAHAQALGETEGEYDPDGSVTFLKEGFNEIIERLGDGYLQKRGTITVTYKGADGKTKRDTLHGVRIREIDDSHSQGTAGLEVKCQLRILWIERNGKKPLTNMLQNAA